MEMDSRNRGSMGGEDFKAQGILKELEAFQKELDSVNKSAKEESIRVEKNYNKQMKPYFEKRNEILSKIPYFWAKTLIKHPLLNIMIDNEVMDCLKYVTKLEVDDLENGESGFKINIFFEKNNPYIENSLLTKDIFIGGNGCKSKSTPIIWKENRNLCHNAKTTDKKMGNGRKRVNQEEMFFDWFCGSGGKEDFDVIAEAIKDEICPNPLHFYLEPDEESESGDEKFEDDMTSEENELEDENQGMDEERGK